MKFIRGSMFFRSVNHARTYNFLNSLVSSDITCRKLGGNTVFRQKPQDQHHKVISSSDFWNLFVGVLVCGLYVEWSGMLFAAWSVHELGFSERESRKRVLDRE